MRQGIAASISLVLAIAPFSAGQGRVRAATSGSRSAIASSAEPQAKMAPNVRVGVVMSVQQSASQISIKTDSGEVEAASLTPETIYKRIQAGATSLDQATPATIADIAVGDRVYLQGRVSQQNQFIVHQVLVMAKRDVEKVHEQEKEQWKRGVAGQVSGVTPDARRITVQMRAPEGPKTVTVAVTNSTVLRRYSPDSVKFSDAIASRFDDLKVGDQVRARGEKSGDGSMFSATEIVSGSFQTVGGIVTAVNPAANEVKITVLGSKKPATVVIRSDTILRKLTPQLAALIAQRSRPPGGPASQGGATPPPANRQGAPPPAASTPPGGAARQAGPQPAGGAPQNQSPPKTGTQLAAGSQPAAAPKAGGQPQGAAPATPPKPRLDERKDTQELIEELPALPLGEVKLGDVIVVSSTAGTDPARLNAIMFVTGVDAVLNAYYRGQRPPDLNTGLPGGMLLGIGQP